MSQNSPSKFRPTQLLPWLALAAMIVTAVLTLFGSPSILLAQSVAEESVDDNGGSRTAYELAKLAEEELGVPPAVDIADGVEITIYVDGKKHIGNPGRHCCDNPSLQVGDCMSGSSLQRFEGRTAEGERLPHVVWISFVRHDGRQNQVDSIQLIGYNRKTGATAFFESKYSTDFTHLDKKTNRVLGKIPGIEDPEAFNRAYQFKRGVQCVECHQNSPFIHNDFIDSAKLPDGKTVVPKLKGDSPYYVIGGEDWDMRTVHIEGNGCFECHRVGMKTVELFMWNGWDPNRHMPPRKPGSLKEDFEELLEVWEKGPEAIEGADWIIPPARGRPFQVVGDDYPYKREFNRPRKLHLIKPKKTPLPTTGTDSEDGS